jgi:hypothetical protein
MVPLLPRERRQKTNADPSRAKFRKPVFEELRRLLSRTQTTEKWNASWPTNVSESIDSNGHRADLFPFACLFRAERVNRIHVGRAHRRNEARRDSHQSEQPGGADKRDGIVRLQSVEKRAGSTGRCERKNCAQR